MARADEDDGRAPADGAEPPECGGSDVGRSEGAKRSGGDRKPSALKKPWVKALLAIAGIAVLVGGGFWGFRYWTVGRFIQETNDAYVQADQVAISPQVSGYIASVPVAANQIVTAGQVLATVDDGQYRAKLAQQQAQVDARQADLARAEAEVVRQQAQIDQAKAQVAASQVSTIDVLDVERQRLQAEQGLAQAQAEYTNEHVALQKSLGLGWGLPNERVAMLRR
jgi:membrane fusion protein, multidrug efflux system